jgi:hypothetical protein
MDESPTDPYCSDCGTPNPFGKKFCGKCGATNSSTKDQGEDSQHVGQESGSSAVTWTKERPKVLIGGAVLLVAILIIGLIFATSGSGPTQQPSVTSGSNYISPSQASKYVNQTATVRMTVVSAFGPDPIVGDYYLFPVTYPGFFIDPNCQFSVEIYPTVGLVGSGGPSLNSYLGDVIDVTGQVLQNGPGVHIVIAPSYGNLTVVKHGSGSQSSQGNTSPTSTPPTNASPSRKVVPPLSTPSGSLAIALSVGHDPNTIIRASIDPNGSDWAFVDESNPAIGGGWGFYHIVNGTWKMVSFGTASIQCEVPDSVLADFKASGINSPYFNPCTNSQ